LHLVKFRQGARDPKMYIYCISPGDGQTSCRVWLASGERRRCSNEGKTRNPLKFAGVPQTPEPISAVSRPKFAIYRYCEDMWRRYCRLTSLFRLSMHAFVAKIQPNKILRDGAQTAIFWRPVFSASRVQQISNLHSKFALRPRHVWKYGRHPISDR